MIYVHVVWMAVQQGLFCGHWSILYRFMSGGFGYQHLFCHALPSHFVFPSFFFFFAFIYLLRLF